MGTIKTGVNGSQYLVFPDEYTLDEYLRNVDEAHAHRVCCFGGHFNAIELED